MVSEIEDAPIIDICCDQAYDCPITGEVECLIHDGFDVCCDNPACPGSRIRDEWGSYDDPSDYYDEMAASYDE